MLRVLVPEVKRPVRASGAEGAVLRMERDGVDGVDIADILVVGGLLTVAFEGEVVALVFVVHILDCAAAFYASNRKSGAVCEGADDPRLPFQRRLHLFKRGCRVLEVDDVDPTFCCADDEHLVASYVHGVDSVFTLETRDGLLLP